MEFQIPDFRPIGDNVLVLPADMDERTEGGIVLPDRHRERPLRGVVVAVGIGQIVGEDEWLIPPPVEPGDLVWFKPYVGQKLKLNGAEWIVLRIADLLCAETGE